MSALAPATGMFRFRYSTNISINAAASASPTEHTFRANSLFDPDLTGVGHQPYGFDQKMLFYNHFTVLGCKVEARFLPSAVPPQSVTAVGIAISPGQNLNETYEQLRESKNGTHSLLTYGTDNKPKMLTLKFSSSKFFGKSPASMIGDTLYRGSATANPTEGAYIQVWVCGVNVLDNPDNIDVQVNIDYVAVLTERKELAQS